MFVCTHGEKCCAYRVVPGLVTLFCWWWSVLVIVMLWLSGGRKGGREGGWKEGTEERRQEGRNKGRKEEEPTKEGRKEGREEGRKEGRREGENAAGYGHWIFASNCTNASDCCSKTGSTNGVFVKDLSYVDTLYVVGTVHLCASTAPSLFPINRR